MASVKILLYTHKTLKDGSYPIVLSIIKDRKRKLISLGYAAKVTQWNQEKNLPNSKHPHYSELTKNLKRKLHLAEKAIMDLDDKSMPFSVDDIAEAITDKKKTSSFKEYTTELISMFEKTGRYGNARVYEDAKNAFLKFHEDKDIDIKYINYKILKQFEEYLQARNHKVNGISVYLRTIRAIYNKAIKDKIVSDKYYPFKNFKITNEPTRKRAISKDSIKELSILDLSTKPHLQLARDIFMFSFYSRGMNFIDIFYMKEKDIIDGRIEYSRRKTKKKFSIKITDEAQLIINRCSKHIGPESYLFPVLKPGNEYKSYRTAVRNLNKYLKVVGNSIGLNVPLTSYVARHSWATIGKRAGIPTAIISEGLGHDTEQTTQIYLDSFPNEELDNANEIIIK
jgi:integrase